MRVQAIFNGSLDQAEDNCAAGGTLGGIGEQEVFSVNDKGLDTSLSTVIGNLQLLVVSFFCCLVCNFLLDSE